MDWQELCKKCHYKYDVQVLGKQAYGGPDKKHSFNSQTAKISGAVGGKIGKRGKAAQHGSKKILYDGKIFYPSQLADYLGVSRQAISLRIKAGKLSIVPKE